MTLVRCLPTVNAAAGSFLELRRLAVVLTNAMIEQLA